MDLSEQDSTLFELLTQHGALPGPEVTRQQDEQDAESALEKAGPVDEETLSIPSVRPTTPSRRSFAGDPVFESDQSRDYAASPQQPSRPTTPAPPPSPPPDLMRQGPGLLKKAFSMMKRRVSKQPSDSILSSVVALYAAQMTMLAAAVVG